MAKGATLPSSPLFPLFFYTEYAGKTETYALLRKHLDQNISSNCDLFEHPDDWNDFSMIYGPARSPILPYRGRTV